MFYLQQSDFNKNEYENYLKLIGCLSKLFSDSSTPYLYYRVAEKIFCRAFGAEDLSRSDVALDAKKGSLGIGLKTFLRGSNHTFQKVAEFNKQREAYIGLTPKALVTKVSELRNRRIEFTEQAHNINDSIYHCVIRDNETFKIFEETMDRVDINNIRLVKKNSNSIVFEDGIHEYSFLLSKSTLTKRFITETCVGEFNVNILADPLTELRNCLNLINTQTYVFQEKVFLPLYGSNKTVYPKSGLNQWNAAGRDRDVNEVYIPVPIAVHHKYPDFFPPRDVLFTLKFPDGEEVEAKMCQANRKALMTQSNRKLGQLILRGGLKLNEGELATYERLQILGIDSVRIDKINNHLFEINFARTGSYENFIEGRI